MHYAQFQLFNYKGFLDSGPIVLKPGFNIFTGQNDAGKTALLEALSLAFEHRPHRSLLNTPGRTPVSREASRADCRLVLSQQDLQDFLSDKPQLWLPALKNPGRQDNIGAIPLRINDFLGQHESSIDLTLSNGGITSFHIPPLTAKPERTNQSHFQFIRNDSGAYSYSGRNSTTSSVGIDLWQHIHNRIYSFRAERFKIGRFEFGNQTTLAPDAGNLPQVLNALQANPFRFQRFIDLTRRVFPHIQHITLPPISSKEVEIRLWTDDPSQEREDLTIPLTESGTGIGQVLAMLYVLVTADVPRIIIIDEPNSFLNPGAVRSLVEILREYHQHQYIVTTHSPEFIIATEPSTVHILRRHKPAEPVDAKETRHLRNILSEVGSRLSDVFGADNILWVEGPTEEQCFPLILRKLLKRPLGRTAIIGVIHTGDFEHRKDASLIMRIYERLSRGPALLPPAIGFIFDRETRPDQERQDLIRASKKRITFLARRTYENYLLNPTAIAAVLSEQLSSQGKAFTAQDIKAWIDQHKAEPKYFGKAKERDFLVDIDAPKLLSDLFSDLSEQTLEYIKTEHSIRLTEWLLEHDPKALDEIAKLIEEKLATAPDENSAPS